MLCNDNDLPEDAAIVDFKVAGPAITDPYPLHEIISILECFHTSVDQAYLVLTAKSKMTRSERQSFKILASMPRAGSYEQELMIAYSLAQPLLAFVPQLTASAVWQTTKSAFELLKTLATLRRNGQTPGISAPNNEGIIAISQPGGGPIHIHQTVLQVADKSEESYARMTERIQEGRIETISAVDRTRQGIVLGQAEKELFNPETEVEDTPVDVVGTVFGFNTDRMSGRIRVAVGQSVPADDYTFDLADRQDFAPYAMAMVSSAPVTLRCLKKVAVHSTGVRSVSRLIAVGIKTPKAIRTS